MKKIVLVFLFALLFSFTFNSYANNSHAEDLTRDVNNKLETPDTTPNVAIDVDGMVEKIETIAINNNIDNNKVDNNNIDDAKEVNDIKKEDTDKEDTQEWQKVEAVVNNVNENIDSNIENKNIDEKDITDKNIEDKNIEDIKSKGLYDSSLDWIDEEEQAKKEKFILDYKQARTNEAIVDILRSRSLDARVDARGIIINLENALFEFNSATLSPKARPHIKEIAKFLQSLPERTVEAQGHTDSVGTVIYNYKLSQGRAKNVVQELVENGVSRSRLEYKGYGESDPIATNRTEEGRERNRRVELVVK
ncbi:MAG: OmpA family protein [Bdellovibrionota bacterium]